MIFAPAREEQGRQADEKSKPDTAAAESAEVILNSDLNREFFRWTHCIVALWLVFSGHRFFSSVVEESKQYQPGTIFLQLADQCHVLGVDYESITISMSRAGMDRVQRMHPWCLDLYRYNFTVGVDAQEEKSGYERLRRSEKTCEASTVDGDHLVPASHRVGDRVDCWRPMMSLTNLSVALISCGRPTCTAADIYSCSVPDCVQLTDPAEEFLLAFGHNDIWEVLGRCLMLSGVVMMFSVIAGELRYPQAVTCIVKRNLLCSVLISFASAFYAFMIVGVSSEVIQEYIVSRVGVYFDGLMWTALAVSIADEIIEIVRGRVDTRDVGDDEDLSFSEWRRLFLMGVMVCCINSRRPQYFLRPLYTLFDSMKDGDFAY
jgi:hypothetical protein